MPKNWMNKPMFPSCPIPTDYSKGDVKSVKKPSGAGTKHSGSKKSK